MPSFLKDGNKYAISKAYSSDLVGFYKLFLITAYSVCEWILVVGVERNWSLKNIYHKFDFHFSN